MNELRLQAWAFGGELYAAAIPLLQELGAMALELTGSNIQFFDVRDEGSSIESQCWMTEHGSDLLSEGVAKQSDLPPTADDGRDSARDEILGKC